MLNSINLIILNAAKIAGVSGQLLLAICNHESMNFKFNYSPIDKKSPSYGYCQLKYETAVQMGFNGKSEDLLKTTINAKYSAKYLKYQLDRYQGNVLKSVAAYNSGTYFESKKNPGCPKNLEYVKKVKRLIVERNIAMMLECDMFTNKFAKGF